VEFTEELLTKTQATLLEDYGIDFSLDETNEILNALTKYVTVLHDIETNSGTVELE